MFYSQEFTIPNGSPRADVAAAHRALGEAAGGAEYGFLRGCRPPRLAELHECASRYERFSKVFVMATGASAACGRVWLQAYGSKKPMEFVSAVTPSALANCHVEDDDRGFLFISRSGATAEIVSQFRALADLCKNPADRFAVLSIGGDNPIVRAAAAVKVPTYHLDGNISGRFSIFNEAGLLPAIIGGVAPPPLLAAAAAVAADALKRADAPPAQAAANIFALWQLGFTTAVTATYDPALRALGKWLSQLYAESLGKNGKGINPLAASCPADQHSQLQLWLDGPRDKFITIIDGEPSAAAAFSEQANKRLLRAHERLRTVTVECLIKAKVPVRVIRVNNVAALVMHYLLETWFLAKFLGVNPFDQPAVGEMRTTVAAAM